MDAKRKKELFQQHSAVHPMLKCIADMDKEVRQKAIKCLYDVYNDAKRGTLSAWSWPSRVMAEYAAKHFDFENTGDHIPFSPTAQEAQYINAVQHREFLSYIAELW